MFLLISGYWQLRLDAQLAKIKHDTMNLTVPRFLALMLPTLTLATHLLLSLSFALLGDDQGWAFWSLIYNGTAAFASLLGLVGAVRVSSSHIAGE
jgi:hypothetical protein